MQNFKFKINDQVMVKGLACVIQERELFDGKPDYLCKPLDITKVIFGQDTLGAGWVYEENIELIKNEMQLNQVFDDMRLQAVASIEEMLSFLEKNKNELVEWELQELNERLKKALYIVDRS